MSFIESDSSLLDDEDSFLDWSSASTPVTLTLESEDWGSSQSDVSWNPGEESASDDNTVAELADSDTDLQDTVESGSDARSAHESDEELSGEAADTDTQHSHTSAESAESPDYALLYYYLRLRGYPLLLYRQEDAMSRAATPDHELEPGSAGAPSPDASSPGGSDESDAATAGTEQEGLGADAELPAVSVSEGARRSHSPSGEGPPRKLARRQTVEDEGDTCPICMDAWSSSGNHRLVCLKCGHVFGYECVVRWLKTHPAKERCCPTCKARATLRDIRQVYARRLVAVDNSEVESARRQLEQARGERTAAELELHNARLLAANTMAELNLLRAQMKKQNGSAHDNKSDEDRWHFSLERAVEIAPERSCRVLAYNCNKYELYASHKSTLSLFPGFGVRKIDCVSMKPLQFVPLHPREIRDLDYTYHSELLLSVSLDKTARLTCGRTNRAVGTVRADRPLWSCSWNASIPNQFALGCEGGVCLTYDARHLSAPLARVSLDRDRSPVVSTQFVSDSLIACQLNSCRIYKITGPSDFSEYELPIVGPFLSLRYNHEFKQVLVSCRPSSVHPQARHVVASLELGGAGAAPACCVLDTLLGSRTQKLLTRSCQLPLGSALWVGAHSEDDSAILLYSTRTQRLMQSLLQQSVMDMVPLELSGERFLATLSLDKLRLYKATPS